MILDIPNIFSFLFIALIALPLPLIMLGVPIYQVYKNMMRRRYYNMLKKYYEKPFQLTEKQLIEIFPGIKPGKSDNIGYYLDGDYSMEE